MTTAFALTASLLFGLSDFLGAIASRTRSPLQVTAVIQLSALGVVAPIAVVHGADHVAFADISYGVLGGALTALANVALFAALGNGRVSLVVPVAAAVGALVPASVGMVGSTSLSGMTVAGAVSAMIAIPLVATQSEDVRAALPWSALQQISAAAVAGTGFGLFFLLLAQTSERAGLWPTVSNLVIAASITVAVGAARGEIGLRPPGVVVMSGLLLGSAQAFLTLALQRGPLTVASVLASLYPLVTVVLGVVVLGERLTRWHSTGILLAIAGVALIAAG